MNITKPTPPLLTACNPSGNPDASFFTLHCIESDSSRLRYVEGVGTVLDKSCEREFELLIYERDRFGYCGLAAQFSSDHLQDAIQHLLNLAELNPTLITNFAPLCTA